ncbi:MAG: hypothetical protein DDT25_00027 [Chloroflexi bacterium]|nr:hypothetical protein [Chloroflexota bacterium]
MLFDLIFAAEAAKQAAEAADLASLEADGRQGLNPALSGALGIRFGTFGAFMGLSFTGEFNE